MKKKAKTIKSQFFTIKKGLTRGEAALVARKKATRDYRGMVYNPKTGALILT